MLFLSHPRSSLALPRFTSTRWPRKLFDLFSGSPCSFCACPVDRCSRASHSPPSSHGSAFGPLPPLIRSAPSSQEPELMPRGNVPRHEPKRACCQCSTSTIGSQRPTPATTRFQHLRDAAVPPIRVSSECHRASHLSSQSCFPVRCAQYAAQSRQNVRPRQSCRGQSLH